MGTFPEVLTQRFFVCGFLACGLAIRTEVHTAIIIEKMGTPSWRSLKSIAFESIYTAA